MVVEFIEGKKIVLGVMNGVKVTRRKDKMDIYFGKAYKTRIKRIKDRNSLEAWLSTNSLVINSFYNNMF
jgi:hypothetical protein